MLVSDASHVKPALVDADLQSPALNVLLGTQAPSECHSLTDFLLGRCEIDQAALTKASAHIQAWAKNNCH